MAETVWVVAVVVAVVVANLITQRFLPAYASEKGKNLATKEDIGEITRLIEDVKAANAKELETIRADINARLGIHHFRYQREYDMLREVAAKVAECQAAALSLRPELDYALASAEAEEERRQKRHSRYLDAVYDLYSHLRAHRPFLPLSLHGAVSALTMAAQKEAIAFRRQSPTTNPKYWEDAEANAANIGRAAEHVVDEIRTRVQYWERFDPAASPGKQM